MKPLKTISIVAISTLAGLFIGQAQLALSKPPQQNDAQSLVRSNQFIIQGTNAKDEGFIAASKRNGGVFSLRDPRSTDVSVLEIANPPGIALISNKNSAFVRFAFEKSPTTHIVSPVIQMEDSAGNATEMNEHGKVRSIKPANILTWYRPEN